MDKFSAVQLPITLRTATFGLNFEFADLGKNTFPEIPVRKGLAATFSV